MFYFGKRKNSTVYLLVTLQFLCIFLILISGPWYPNHPVLIILYIFGFIIGIWGIVSMNAQTLNIPPNVRPSAQLTQRGPYAVIRHPMYIAIILVTLPLVITKPTLFRIITETTLIVDLLLKITIEERMLDQNLRGYRDYRKKTWRIIPYIY